jgi:ADP-dependent NAD(P)H-hydrate dehydratase / NAD(P)H-hydrate epimerase
VMPPTCDLVGELIVVPIGTPPEIIDGDPTINIYLSRPPAFRSLFLPRARGANKGDFGHILVIGGAQGKGGAAAMAGLSALRSGAGLVTVASADEERGVVTRLAPELMTQSIESEYASKDVLAVGPGLGKDPGWAAFARRLFAEAPQPLVLDADGLNAIAGTDFRGPGALRVLTPHPGEMSRLTGMSIADIQSNRLTTARSFALHRHVVLVLKGQRTLIAFPDGEVWVNPTGTPAMATAGTGDILTGLLAGLLGQFPDAPKQAVLAGVWLHGRAGELGANAQNEQTLIATDLLRYLPDAFREIQGL